MPSRLNAFLVGSAVIACGVASQLEDQAARLELDDICNVQDPACSLNALQHKARSDGDSQTTAKHMLSLIATAGADDTSNSQDTLGSQDTVTSQDSVDSHDTGSQDTVGSLASVDANGYKTVAMSNSESEMSSFARRVIEHLGGSVLDMSRLKELGSKHSGGLAHGFEKLLQDISEISKDAASSWILLPPPLPGKVTYRMVEPTQYKCSLLNQIDPRNVGCEDDVSDQKLSPFLIDCGQDSNNPCSPKMANAFRLNYEIGSLPCCPYSENACAAPMCDFMPKADGALKADKEHVAPKCTDRPASESVQYLTGGKTWPAYHGYGGAFELDALKIIDMLGCRSDAQNCQGNPINTVVDIGSGEGEFSEMLLARNFARTYVMIEANSNKASSLRNRWYNQDYRSNWFGHQYGFVPPSMGASEKFKAQPNILVMHSALSHMDGHKMNMCINEPSMAENTDGCSPSSVTFDSMYQTQVPRVFRNLMSRATSSYIRLSAGGMDQMILEGMAEYLGATRGNYTNGEPRHLVNFIQVKVNPSTMQMTQSQEDFKDYNLKTMVKQLAGLGFVSFLMGPRYIQLSHGAWSDKFLDYLGNPSKSRDASKQLPDLSAAKCHWCKQASKEDATRSFEILAIRNSYPDLQKLKLALGACSESHDFTLQDKEYTHEAPVF